MPKLQKGGSKLKMHPPGKMLCEFTVVSSFFPSCGVSVQPYCARHSVMSCSHMSCFWCQFSQNLLAVVPLPHHCCLLCFVRASQATLLMTETFPVTPVMPECDRDVQARLTKDALRLDRFTSSYGRSVCVLYALLATLLPTLLLSTQSG